MRVCSTAGEGALHCEPYGASFLGHHAKPGKLAFYHAVPCITPVKCIHPRGISHGFDAVGRAPVGAQACRNFVQLCLEGYYDSTIFHRIIKDYLVQGGDPTGSGDCEVAWDLEVVRWHVRSTRVLRRPSHQLHCIDRMRGKVMHGECTDSRGPRAGSAQRGAHPGGCAWLCT